MVGGLTMTLNTHLLIPLFITLGFALFLLLLRWRTLVRAAKALDPRNIYFGTGWRVIRLVAAIVAIIFLIIAVARPRWGVTSETVDASTRDVFIALDVSQSMKVADVVPSRIAVAQNFLTSLLEQLPVDRTGLILFADKPVLQAPLTHDITLVKSFIQEAPAFVGGGGTRFDSLLQMVLQHLADGKQVTKLLIIVSDGEDFSTSLQDLIGQIKQAGITIITVGVGTAQGAPVPSSDTAFVTDKQGNPVISRLQHGTLQQLAQSTGGAYAELHENKDATRLVNSLIERAERGQLGPVAIDRLIERYPYAVFIALMALLVEIFVW